MTVPALEVLGALLRVLEAQAAEERAAHATKEARAASDDSVLAAVAAGENTWQRLHAFFPVGEW